MTDAPASLKGGGTVFVEGGSMEQIDMIDSAVEKFAESSKTCCIHFI